MIPRFRILKRDGFRCVYCGATPDVSQLHVDHYQPRSRGGTDHPSNLRTACASCNRSKWDWEPEWRPCSPQYDEDKEIFGLEETEIFLMELGYQKACFARSMPADLVGPEGVGGEPCL
jgi:hypothetical protein